MSAKVFTLVKDYYDPARFGAPIVTAYVLADKADDHGGGISVAHAEIANDTRQTDRAVRLQLRRLESSGLLKCVHRTAGGQGNFNEYRLHLGLLIGAVNPEPRSGLTRNVVPGSEAVNPEYGSGFLDVHIVGTSIDNVEDASTFRVSEGAEDRRLCEWMFGLLLQLNPKHRAPSWPAWMRDVRLMREREKRTRREIAGLFAWANADSFWQGNVLSPAALRRQWDRLVIQRMKKGGNGAAEEEPVDTRCARVKPDGERCTSMQTTSSRTDGRGPFYCWECKCEMDRERAALESAQRAGAHG